jgi:hypothetical protein
LATTAAAIAARVATTVGTATRVVTTAAVIAARGEMTEVARVVKAGTMVGPERAALLPSM